MLDARRQRGGFRGGEVWSPTALQAPALLQVLLVAAL